MTGADGNAVLYGLSCKCLILCVWEGFVFNKNVTDFYTFPCLNFFQYYR